MKTLKSQPQTPLRNIRPGRSFRPAANGNGHSDRSSSAPAVSPELAAWLSQPRQNLIDGKWVPAASGKTFEVFNPADGSVIAHVAEGEAEDIDRAVMAARRAFDPSSAWRRMTPSERGKVIWRIGDLMLKHADELAELESLDNGKPRAVARVADMPLAADLFHYMAGWATKIEGKPFRFSVPYARSSFPRLHLARADRRGRADHSLEFSVAHGRVEAWPGAGRRAIASS